MSSCIFYLHDQVVCDDERAKRLSDARSSRQVIKHWQVRVLNCYECEIRRLPVLMCLSCVGQVTLLFGSRP